MGSARYEISTVECMHDIAGHIENILLELPNHLEDPDKSLIKEFVNQLRDEKTLIRCCDQRF